MSQPVLNNVNINCSCGHSFVTRLPIQIEIMKVEICSNCHPFYTKEQKIIDTEGTITAFNRRFKSKSQDLDKN